MNKLLSLLTSIVKSAALAIRIRRGPSGRPPRAARANGVVSCDYESDPRTTVTSVRSEEAV